MENSNEVLIEYRSSLGATSQPPLAVYQAEIYFPYGLAAHANLNGQATRVHWDSEDELWFFCDGATRGEL